MVFVGNGEETSPRVRGICITKLGEVRVKSLVVEDEPPYEISQSRYRDRGYTPPIEELPYEQ